MHIRNNDCAIGIIASPRQTGLQFSHPHKDRAAPGTGTSLLNRGKYQFTGHTAVFLRIGNERKIVRGLVPHGILDTIRGVLFKSTVHGKWQDDENLFHDKTSKITEITIPLHIAEKFQTYFDTVAKEKLSQYVLSPESGTQGNCVYSALTILIDFMYEHQHLFTQEQWQQLENQLNQIISDTAKRAHCMQGHLISNIEKWGGNFQFSNLLDDIKDFLKTEIIRLENKKDNGVKLFVAKKTLTDLIMLQSKKELDKEAIEKIISYTQVFAYHKRTRNEPTSRAGWDKIKIAYNLNVKIAESNIYTLYFDYKKISALREIVHNRGDSLKSVIKNMLNKQDSSLSLYLRTLSEEDKSKLIAALLSNNFDVLQKYLLHSLLGIEFDELKIFLEMAATEKYWNNHLNGTVKKIIRGLLKNANDQALPIKNKKRILQDAFKLVPDENMDVSQKAKIAYQIDKKTTKQIAHFSYSPSEFTAVQHVSTRHTYIRDSEFVTIIKQPELEASQFIIVALDFLEAKLEKQQEPMLLERFKKIRQFYLMTEYENAIAEIKTLAVQHADKLTSPLSTLIAARADKLAEPDIHKNHHRRFFENKLAQHFMTSALDIHSIDKISSFLIGKQVNNASKAQSAILDISHRHDIHALKRYQMLVKQSELMKTRDRIKKEGFIDRTKENQGEKGENVYSRNQGLLKSISPNFYDEITDGAIKNPIVDLNTIKQNSSGYSNNHNRVAFVGSISGHIYFIVAMLEKYMNAHKNDAQLNKDINAFIKAFICTYITHGYHSLLEMVHVFSDPQLKEIFRKNNVEIDLSFSDQDDVLKQAFYDAQEYSKTLSLKSALHTELLNKHSQKINAKNIEAEMNISLDGSDMQIAAKGARIIYHELEKHQITQFRLVENKIGASQAVVYQFRATKKTSEWENIIKNITKELVNNKIHPGHLPKEDVGLSGSNYFSAPKNEIVQKSFSEIDIQFPSGMNQPDRPISKKAEALQIEVMGAIKKLKNYANTKDAGNSVKANKMVDDLTMILKKIQAIKNNWDGQEYILMQLKQQYKEVALNYTRNKISQGTTAILSALNLKSASRYDQILKEIQEGGMIANNHSPIEPTHQENILLLEDLVSKQAVETTHQNAVETSDNMNHHVINHH